MRGNSRVRFESEDCPHAGDHIECQSGPEGPGGGGRRSWIELECTAGGGCGDPNLCTWQYSADWKDKCATYWRIRAEASEREAEDE